MTTAETYDPDTHMVVKKHHMRWIILGLILFLGIGLAVAYKSGGNISYEDGKPVLTVPSMDALRGLVKIRTADNSTVMETTIQPPALPAPNGQTSTLTDGFGAEHRLQREEVVTRRYDPIDELKSNISDTSKQVGQVNESVKAVGQQVQGLTGSITKLDGRVSALETAKAAPVPTPKPTSQPAPQASAQAPAANQQVAGLNYKVPDNWHIAKVYGAEKSKACARRDGKIGQLVLSQRCKPIGNGGLHCEWDCK